MHLNGTALKMGLDAMGMELLRQEMYFINAPTLLVLSLCQEHSSGQEKNLAGSISSAKQENN